MDERELHEHLERNHEAAFGWALHCCGIHSADAEEVLQTTYLKILSGRARFKGRSSFKTWLFAVIRCTAADERRRSWFSKMAFVRLERLRPRTECSESAADVYERSQLQKSFQAALARLPARQREVLHLVFYQEFSVEAAAEVMGVSVGSARQHYHRGKERLRQFVEALERVDERR